MEEKYIEFDYRITNEKTITKQILYANTTFDVKDVLSNKTSNDCCAVSIITSTQMVSVAFENRLSTGGHASIADIILSRIYPNYIRSKDPWEQSVYFRERENNVFILICDQVISINLPKGEKINKMQYNCLKKFIEEIKETDYMKSGRILEIFFDDLIYDLDGKMNSIKENIVEKDIPKQYPINTFDFSKCTNKEEYMSCATMYAEKLHNMIDSYKMSKNKINQVLQNNVVEDNER